MDEVGREMPNVENLKGEIERKMIKLYKIIY